MTAICGMIGAWAAEPRAHEHLSAMLGAMAPRAPGAAAVWADRGGLCRLGVTGGPGASPGARVIEAAPGLAMVCDGHVFNPIEVAAGLPDGVAPTRDSAELLLHLWVDQGARGLRRADGQFALAIWDGLERRLILARDFLGVRSLYLHAGPGGVLFASSIAALLRHPAVPAEIDEQAVSHFLTFLDVPTPRTLFAGIAKLPPGSLAVCGARGVERTERYWDLLDDPLPEVDDPGYYVAQVRARHRDALAGRLVDGPMGALLSGGNDSSANVALMARLGVAPLHTFTVGLAGFEGQDRYSDLVHARRVAALTGAIHHEKLISVEQFLASIPEVIDAQDDLVSEPSSVFLHHALAMVREQGLRVVITGEANDEIACGHGEMMRIRDGYYRRWRPLMRLPRPVRRALASIAARLSPRRADVLGRAADDGEYFWSFETAWTDHDKASILAPDVLARTRGEPAAAVVAERVRRWRRTDHARRDYLGWIIGCMMQDHYLGNLMLGKLERLAAPLGVEPRCPYTAPAYVHLVYNIPARFKTQGGVVKAFFKDAIADLLPREIIHRPKQGFRTPVAELFAGALGAWAAPILLEQGLTRAGVLRRDHLEALLAEHRAGGRDLSNRLWTAMVLNLWYERWINQARALAA